jgi:hypothetical protein
MQTADQERYGIILGLPPAFPLAVCAAAGAAARSVEHHNAAMLRLNLSFLNITPPCRVSLRPLSRLDVRYRFVRTRG